MKLLVQHLHTMRHVGKTCCPHDPSLLPKIHGWIRGQPASPTAKRTLMHILIQGNWFAIVQPLHVAHAGAKKYPGCCGARGRFGTSFSSGFAAPSVWFAVGKGSRQIQFFQSGPHLHSVRKQEFEMYKNMIVYMKF